MWSQPSLINLFSTKLSRLITDLIVSQKIKRLCKYECFNKWHKPCLPLCVMSVWATPSIVYQHSLHTETKEHEIKQHKLLLHYFKFLFIGQIIMNLLSITQKVKQELLDHRRVYLLVGALMCRRASVSGSFFAAEYYPKYIG